MNTQLSQLAHRTTQAGDHAARRAGALAPPPALCRQQWRQRQRRRPAVSASASAPERTATRTVSMRPPRVPPCAASEAAIEPPLPRPQQAAQPPAGATQEQPAEGGQQSFPDWLPKLGLIAVACLWGSYAPSVRFLYSLPDPPETAVVMAVRGVVQASAMLTITLALARQQQGQPQASADEQQAATDAGSSSSDGKGDSSTSTALPGGAADLFGRWLRLESPPLWMAALELGLWNFSATSLQTISLQLISATRASFLVQATLLLTPILSAASGYNLSKQVWAGCALALAGCLLITAEEADAGAVANGLDAAGLSLGGDTAILASALFYSLGVVRVSGYARSLPSVQLATGKSLVLGGLALSSLAVAAAGVALQGEELSSLWGGYAQPTAWLALAWAGLGPGALASYLNIVGQKYVPPAQAQVIFSSKPLFAAGLAWFLLGGEQLGPLTWVGGSMLVLAGFIASTGEQRSAESDSEEEEPAAAAAAPAKAQPVATSPGRR